MPALEYFACPKCHEQIYPPEAMRRIQERSPAYQDSPNAASFVITGNLLKILLG